jgi:6,7-dimethyl-8-ribityllumazine synthase
LSLTQNVSQGINTTLEGFGVDISTVETAVVPTIMELPLAAKFLTASKKYDSVLCIGCHEHDDYSRALSLPATVAQQLLQLSVETMVQCVPAIVLVKSKAQIKSTRQLKNYKDYRIRLVNETLTGTGANFAKIAISNAVGRFTATHPKEGRLDTNSVQFFVPADVSASAV